MQFKQGDWLMTKRNGNIGVITNTKDIDNHRLYRVKFINRKGQWEERTAKDGLEQRARVITKEVADIFISTQLNIER